MRCSAEANALVVKAVSGPGAVRLTQFAFPDGPACFAPERRPFSRGPVTASPDPHPAIADALVEWDWRMQDGIQTPREPRTYRQAIEKIVRQTDALVAERLGSKTLSPDEESAWKKLRAAGLPPSTMPRPGRRAGSRSIACVAKSFSPIRSSNSHPSCLPNMFRLS